VRLGRYFGNSAQFWLDLQGQYDIGVVEREKGAEIARRLAPVPHSQAMVVIPLPSEKCSCYVL
jgi:plasmid maintenance system antidote protein VapI